MIVHGGKNSEGRQILYDFNIFDLGINEWLPMIISLGKLNDKHQFCDEEQNNKKVLGERFQHVITAVYDKGYYRDKY